MNDSPSTGDSPGGDAVDRINTGLDKSLNVLEFVAQGGRGRSLAAIARGVGLPKTTVHRILDILATRGYVEWNVGSETYGLGLKALEIGVCGLAGVDLVTVAIPYLQQLSADTGETSFLAVYDSGDVVYLYKAEGTASVQTTARLGSRRPAYCTALGKAILANLPLEEADRVLARGLVRFTERTVVDRVQLYDEFAAIRRDGVAVDDEGIEPGLYCLAVPVYDYTGGVVGAISVSGPTARMSEQRERLCAALREAGDTISRRLGYVHALRARAAPAHGYAGAV